MNVTIIEDEPLIADALEEKIKHSNPEIKVIAKLESIVKALKYLKHNELPDLFFSDIELRDGLSFEIFREIKNTTPIIFCTAYNHYALNAFQVYGIDYLLKPFKQVDIDAAINKYKTLVENPTKQTPDIQEVIKIIENKKNGTAGTVLIYRGDKIIPLEKSKIRLAELSNGLVYVYTLSNERFAVNYSLDKLQNILGSDFYRVNRCFVINRQVIDYVAQHFARKLIIKPSFNFTTPLLVSKAKASEFLKWLEAH